jgi:hypothetical protein
LFSGIPDIIIASPCCQMPSEPNLSMLDQSD